MLYGKHCVVIFHKRWHLIPDSFARISVHRFGVNGLGRFNKAVGKTEVNLIECFFS